MDQLKARKRTKKHEIGCSSGPTFALVAVFALGFNLKPKKSGDLGFGPKTEVPRFISRAERIVREIIIV